MATFSGLCCQDIVERRTVELERGEEGLGIAIQVGNIHSSRYMQRKNQIHKFMLCFFTGLQGGLDFKLPVSIDTVFDNSPGMQQIFLLVQNLLKEREGGEGRGQIL